MVLISIAFLLLSESLNSTSGTSNRVASSFVASTNFDSIVVLVSVKLAFLVTSIIFDSIIVAIRIGASTSGANNCVASNLLLALISIALLLLS